METRIFDREDLYFVDVVETVTGKIVVTYTAGIKTKWFTGTTIMEQALYDANRAYCDTVYTNFLTDATARATANGLTIN